MMKVLPCMLMPDDHSRSGSPAGSFIRANCAIRVVPGIVARTSAVKPWEEGVGGEAGFCARPFDQMVPSPNSTPGTLLGRLDCVSSSFHSAPIFHSVRMAKA